MASPCIDVCRCDEAAGWCFDCGMTQPGENRWKKCRAGRPSLCAALAARLAAAGWPTGKAARRAGKR